MTTELQAGTVSTRACSRPLRQKHLDRGVETGEGGHDTGHQHTVIMMPRPGDIVGVGLQRVETGW